MQTTYDNKPRTNLDFNESRVLRNDEVITFESWETDIQTKGAYSHGMTAAGIGYNGRHATINVPVPTNTERLFDTMLRPSEVRSTFPSFGDKIVIQVRRNPTTSNWVTVFTGTVEETSYDYSSGMATVTCTDGLDLLLDTPVNVESVLGIVRGNPFIQFQQALSNTGVGNTPPFQWNRTILTTPSFAHNSIPLYCDVDALDTGERKYFAYPYGSTLTTEMRAKPHHYAQNYDTGGSGKALLITTRGTGYDHPYTTWNDRECFRVILANGSEIEVGYYGDSTNNGNDYGYYVWTKSRNIVYADKFETFGKIDNKDGRNNPAMSIIYDTGGMTLCVGGKYKVVLSQTLPGGEPGTKVVGVYGRNIICCDVRWEEDWTAALATHRALPQTNVAEDVSQEIFNYASIVLDRADGITLGTLAKRTCEAGLAGFWLDEFGRPCLMDMNRMTNQKFLDTDFVGYTSMLSQYVPRATPAWKAVQVQYHATKVWYTTLSPQSGDDYRIPVYQHPSDKANQWRDGESVTFISPENNKIAWGAVWTDMYTITAGTREPSSRSWVGAVRTEEKDADEMLYEGISGRIYPLINSNYKMVLTYDGKGGGKDIEVRTPKFRTGNGSILIEKYRNMNTPVVRATWKSEKSLAKMTVKDPSWKAGDPVLEVAKEEEVALMLAEKHAPNLANAIIRYSSEMKGELRDFELQPDPRIQIGDTRAITILDPENRPKATFQGTVAGIKMGYSHSSGLKQAISVVLHKEVEMLI